MSNLDNTLLFALGANLLFSTASIIFTQFSRKVSPLWVNTLKAIVAFVCFFISILIFTEFNIISNTSLLLLLLSGALGLAIGDNFLFTAFKILGSGRTLMFFGLQPIILGIFAYFLFDQEINFTKLWGILFFLLCLFLFSLEARKTKGHWEIRGLSFALIGIFIDAGGILLTRYAFDHSPNIGSFEANFYRLGGALIAFIFMARFFRPIHLVTQFKAFEWRSRLLIILGCVMGTFLSLLLYLKAVQSGHLATISGIAITSPLFATLLECVLSKTWPSKYLWAALVSFVIGFMIVL